jgi:hypothetical protein
MTKSRSLPYFKAVEELELIDANMRHGFQNRKNLSASSGVR